MSRIIFAGTLVAACAASTPTQDPAMSNRETVRKLYEECINTGNVELLAELVSDAYVGPNGERGPDGFRQTVTALRGGFPDIRFTIEDLFASDDKVAVRWIWHGTHRGSFRGLAPTGKPLSTTAIVIYQLRDRKIVHSWLQSDRLGTLQQMGYVPRDLTTLARKP
jgi:steroid delta-isomerase-like uncharacterized protein